MLWPAAPVVLLADPSLHRSAGTLKFVPAKGYVSVKGELHFDMYEAEFTHVDDRGSFEVLVEWMGREDRALVAIGELVHASISVAGSTAVRRLPASATRLPESAARFARTSAAGRRGNVAELAATIKKAPDFTRADRSA
jgi:hypothetical protein